MLPKINPAPNRAPRKASHPSAQVLFQKRVFDGVQIAIIVVSSLLTLLESLKVQLDVEEEERDVQRTFALLPIFLSSSVTVSLAVLTFCGSKNTWRIGAKFFSRPPRRNSF